MWTYFPNFIMIISLLVVILSQENRDIKFDICWFYQQLISSIVLFFGIWKVLPILSLSDEIQSKHKKIIDCFENQHKIHKEKGTARVEHRCRKIGAYVIPPFTIKFARIIWDLRLISCDMRNFLEFYFERHLNCVYTPYFGAAVRSGCIGAVFTVTKIASMKPNITYVNKNSGGKQCIGKYGFVLSV